jgi:hypothetical protein
VLGHTRVLGRSVYKGDDCLHVWLFDSVGTLYSLLFTRLASPRLLSYCFTRAVERQGSIAATYSISYSSHSIWDLMPLAYRIDRAMTEH